MESQILGRLTEPPSSPGPFPQGPRRNRWVWVRLDPKLALHVSSLLPVSPGAAGGGVRWSAHRPSQPARLFTDFPGGPVEARHETELGLPEERGSRRELGPAETPEIEVMGDAQSEGEGPRCVSCGRRVKTLFVQYSPGNIRLMKCDSCKAVADPYIECEFMIILIDLILHKTRAYRHVLFNKLSMGSSVDKGILYQSTLVHIVLDAFRISFSKGNRADGASSSSIFSTFFSWMEVIGDALLGNIIFITILFLGVQFILKLSFNITRYREVLFTIVISSYFKLFLLTMMVWEFPSSVIFIVEMFVLSSNVVALRVVLQFPKAHCFGVCFAAHAAKYLTGRWLLQT